jgi:hypothetical protein
MVGGKGRTYVDDDDDNDYLDDYYDDYDDDDNEEQNYQPVKLSQAAKKAPSKVGVLLTLKL